jgi:outer membrane protein assembly factor BamD (BamD/ComL family)
MCRSCVFALAAIAVAGVLQCAANGKLATYKTRSLIEADSLFDCGNFEAASAQYDKIRTAFPNSNESKIALFSLARLNVYYKNQNGDWATALKEFKSFVTLFPKDEQTDEALSWIRVLTVIKSYDSEFKHASDQVERLKTVRNGARLTLRSSLDSLSVILQRSYEVRDSLAKKNSDLENVIIDLEKKCQQAGR